MACTPSKSRLSGRAILNCIASGTPTRSDKLLKKIAAARREDTKNHVDMHGRINIHPVSFPRGGSNRQFWKIDLLCWNLPRLDPNRPRSRIRTIIGSVGERLRQPIIGNFKFTVGIQRDLEGINFIGMFVWLNMIECDDKPLNALLQINTTRHTLFRMQIHKQRENSGRLRKVILVILIIRVAANGNCAIVRNINFLIITIKEWECKVNPFGGIIKMDSVRFSFRPKSFSKVNGISAAV